MKVSPKQPVLSADPPAETVQGRQEALDSVERPLPTGSVVLPPPGLALAPPAQNGATPSWTAALKCRPFDLSKLGDCTRYPESLGGTLNGLNPLEYVVEHGDSNQLEAYLLLVGAGLDPHRLIPGVGLSPQQCMMAARPVAGHLPED